MLVDQRFDFLVIDPEAGSRAKLKQAALSLTSFRKVYSVSTLKEGMEKAESGEPVDVVALSHRFSLEQVAEFIKCARETTGGREWAYMLVLKSRQEQSTTVASSVMSGVDGFLFEPYSADNLREMAEITAEVKHKNALARLRGALKIVFEDMVNHLDAAAFFRSKGREPVTAMKKLREAAAGLRDICGDDREVFVEVACEVFGNARPFGSRAYTGVSKRVRERLDRKAAERFAEKYRD